MQPDLPSDLKPQLVHLAYFRTFKCVIVFDEGVICFILIVAEGDEITSKELHCHSLYLCVSHDINKRRLFAFAALTGCILIDVVGVRCGVGTTVIRVMLSCCCDDVL